MPLRTNLADWLRDAGLTVVEVDGWRNRGSSSFNPGGVVCHHTADGAGEMPSLRILVHGRSDLPGPLCQVGLARSGACYVVAAGRANHAGRGGWKGMVGNSSVWGIEAENRGGAGDPWPTKQLDAYYLLAKTLQDHTVHPGNYGMVCGHKEWTTRKPDPHSIVMSDFRRRLAEVEEEDLTKDEREMLQRVEKSLYVKRGGKEFEHLTRLDNMLEAIGDKLGLKFNDDGSVKTA